MKPFCYLNGKIIPFAKASLPLNDMAILRGYAAFDFLRTYKGKLFCFKDYFARFKASSKQLGLTIPISEKETEAVIYQLLKKNKSEEASVRLILTGGISSNGFETGTPNFFILIEDAVEPPAKGKTHGVKLITREYERLFPGSKTTNYMFPIREKIASKKEKAFEVLYVNNGEVFECSFSNVFMFKNKKLITPKEGILEGITRSKTIALARKYYEVEERNVSFEELLKADEIFITGSNKRVLPITTIDSHTVAHGKVGEETKHMMRVFEEFTQNQ